MDVPPGGAFLSLSGLTNHLHLTFASQPGSVYDEQRSTNLITWTAVAMDLSAPPSGLLDYIEDPATYKTAFYRLNMRWTAPGRPE